MKRLTMGLVAVLAVFTAANAEASGRYLRHPFFQNLPDMEVRVETQFGYGDTGDLPFGLLGSFGIGMGDSWTVGAYGQVVTSDRDLPNRVKQFFGIGGFAEYRLSRELPVAPYAGVRAGILDSTGPSAPTLPYVGGYAGVLYPLNDLVSFSLALTYHWAGEEDGFEAYDYRRSGSGFRSESSAITLDAGVRLAF